MTETTPIWRCKACDKQFAEPETWPGKGAATLKICDPLEDPEIPIEEREVCPRCHSTAIERWR